MTFISNCERLLTVSLPTLLLISSSASAQSTNGSTDPLTMRLCRYLLVRDGGSPDAAVCRRYLNKDKPQIVKSPARPQAIQSPSLSAPNPGSQPFIFLRQDQFDQINFRENITTLTAVQGASISYSRNDEAHTQTSSIQSYVEASLFQSDEATTISLQRRSRLRLAPCVLAE
jgi:hypothetical protein